MAEVIDAALERLETLEALEHAYEVWGALRAEHAAYRRWCADERRRLEHQGSFLVGAVRAAADPARSPGRPSPTADALAPGDELQRFLGEAESKMTAALAALEARAHEDERRFEGALTHVRAEIVDRIERQKRVAPPGLRVLVRAVGTGRTLLHVERIRGDAAVVLLHALTGRIPSRYGFLEDDSTDDVQQAPAPLYAEEGVAAGGIRPSFAELGSYLRSATTVVAIKGFIPVFVPRAEAPGTDEFFRLLQRGPVLEVERLDEAGGFRSLLTRDEGERFAGHLLRLKLAGVLSLDLSAD